jgi:hypothetical protein
MVDTSLNRRYTAREGSNMDFGPIPDGVYTAKVEEVTPWESQTKSIKVILRDEDGKAIKNEKGDNVTEMQENCTFYNCTAKMKIVGGEYDGRIIFHNLSTHPNMPFQIPAFLYGLGLQELAASEIQDKTRGKLCMIDVYTDSYDKKVQNKDTGLDEIQKKYINRVKSFKQLPATQPNNVVDEDLGI